MSREGDGQWLKSRQKMLTAHEVERKKAVSRVPSITASALSVALDDVAKSGSHQSFHTPTRREWQREMAGLRNLKDFLQIPSFMTRQQEKVASGRLDIFEKLKKNQLRDGGITQSHSAGAHGRFFLPDTRMGMPKMALQQPTISVEQDDSDERGSRIKLRKKKHKAPPPESITTIGEVVRAPPFRIPGKDGEAVLMESTSLSGSGVTTPESRAGSPRFDRRIISTADKPSITSTDTSYTSSKLRMLRARSGLNSSEWERAHREHDDRFDLSNSATGRSNRRQVLSKELHSFGEEIPADRTTSFSNMTSLGDEFSMQQEPTPKGSSMDMWERVRHLVQLRSQATTDMASTVMQFARLSKAVWPEHDAFLHPDFKHKPRTLQDFQDHAKQENKRPSVQNTGLAALFLNNRRDSRRLKDQQRSKSVDKPDESSEKSLPTRSSLFFDRSYYLAPNRTIASVLDEARVAFNKPSPDRTRDDINMIVGILDRLDGMNRYPQSVKRRIARVAFHKTVDQGEVLLRAGDQATTFFYVIAGGVYIEMGMKDFVTSDDTNEIMGVLNKGSSFGELEIMSSSPMLATYFVKQSCSEFLFMSSRDFLMVLGETRAAEIARRVGLLRSQRLTRDWSEAKLRQLSTLCQEKTFDHDEVVFGNTHEVTDMMMCLVTGEYSL